MTQSWYARTADVAWRFIVIVVASAIVLWGLSQVRVIVLPIIVGVVLSTELMAVSDRLRSWGFPPAAAAGVTVAALILGIVALFGFIGVEVAGEFDSLGDDVSEAADEIEDWLVTGPLELDRSSIQEARASLEDAISDSDEQLQAGAVRAGSVVLELVTGFVLAMLIVFFVLKDGHKAPAMIVDVTGRSRGQDLVALGRKVWRALSGYLRGVALTGFVDAVFIGIGLAILGVPLVVPLMLLTFFGAFIPLVGATAAGVVAAMVALVSNGVTAAIVVGILILVVQQVEGNLLAPLVLGRAVQLHPASILLSLTAGGVLFGILGAFLAVPVAAVCKTVAEHYRVRDDDFDDAIDGILEDPHGDGAGEDGAVEDGSGDDETTVTGGSDGTV